MATRNTDLGHQLTDKELETLEKRIASIYKQAAEEMQAKIEKYFARFAKLDAQQKAKLEAGEITEQQYKQWRLNQMGRGERFEALRDALAERMTKANEVAAAYINDATPSIYSLNRNYAAYTIEQVGGDVGFTLFDEQTVKRLIVEEPDVMPYYPEKRAIDRGIDLAYGKRQITAQVTSGILQGESIPNLTKRLQKAIPTMNRDSAVRAARTAVTAAQNGGRMASYKAASDMGIKVRKRWIASKDGRTRDAHRKLDGKIVDWDDSFSSSLGKIRYPGDPRAKPANTYNCRCSLRTVEAPGIEAEARQIRVRDPKTGKNVLVSNMTYEQWQEWAKNR
jgi:SPP1 gp7 family putative phage head morphogenesis protein